MKTLSFAIVTLSLLFGTLSFAEDNGNMDMMTGSVKITKAPAIETEPAQIVAAAYVEAADVAPEGGFGDKDYSKAFQAMGMEGGHRISDFLKEYNVETTGPMFAVWYDDPSETKPQDMTSKWCVPLKAETDPVPGIAIENMPETMAVTCTYMGAYDASMNAWQAVMKYAEDNNLEWTSSPMEVYHKSMMEVENPDDLITEIVWPCKKKR